MRYDIIVDPGYPLDEEFLTATRRDVCASLARKAVYDMLAGQGKLDSHLAHDFTHSLDVMLSNLRKPKPGHYIEYAVRRASKSCVIRVYGG